MYSKRVKLYLSIPLLINILALILSSLQSKVQGPSIIFGIDKLYHFSAFFILAVFSRVFIEVNCINYKYFNKILISIVIPSIYAILDETIQYFTPGRDADLFDILADFIGIAVSMLFWNKIVNYINKRYRLNV